MFLQFLVSFLSFLFSSMAMSSMYKSAGMSKSPYWAPSSSSRRHLLSLSIIQVNSLKLNTLPCFKLFFISNFSVGPNFVIILVKLILFICFAFFHIFNLIPDFHRGCHTASPQVLSYSFCMSINTMYSFFLSNFAL